MTHTRTTALVLAATMIALTSITGCYTVLSAVEEIDEETDEQRTADQSNEDRGDNDQTANDTTQSSAANTSSSSSGVFGGAGDPSVDKIMSSSYSRHDHPKISPENVTLYEYNPDGGQLPEGVHYGHEGQLVYEEAYPTGESEVREAAELEIDSPEDYGASAIQQAMRDTAAELRAQHVVVNPKDGTGTAIFMPDAEPEPVERDPDVLLERQAKEASDSGYTQLVDTRRISLDAPEPLRLDTDAGDCHAIVLALDKDADFNWAARQDLSTEFSHPDPYVDEMLANDPSFESSSAGTKEVRSRRSRSAWTSVGCVDTGGELVVRFLPDDFGQSSSDADTQPALGTGELIVRIYREPGTSVEAIQSERQRAEEEAERRHEEYLQKTCRECVRDHRCKIRDPDAMCDTFRVCLERKGVDLVECRKRNITP